MRVLFQIETFDEQKRKCGFFRIRQAFAVIRWRNSDFCAFLRIIITGIREYVFGLKVFERVGQM